MHWSYCSLALSHQYILFARQIPVAGTEINPCHTIVQQNKCKSTAINSSFATYKSIISIYYNAWIPANCFQSETLFWSPWGADVASNQIISDDQRLQNSLIIIKHCFQIVIGNYILFNYLGVTCLYILGQGGPKIITFWSLSFFEFSYFWLFWPSGAWIEPIRSKINPYLKTCPILLHINLNSNAADVSKKKTNSIHFSSFLCHGGQMGPT